MILVWINLLCQKKKKYHELKMKEPGWVSVRVVAECSVLLARRKREESRDQGFFTRVGRETSLRESFWHSKRGVGVIFPSPVQGPVSQANSSSDLPPCTRLCDGGRMRCSHLLGALCRLLSLTSGKSYSSCFHIDGVIFFHVFHRREAQLDVQES